MLRKFAVVVAAAVAVFAASFHVLDFQQCDRKCRWTFATGQASPFEANSSILDDSSE